MLGTLHCCENTESTCDEIIGDIGVSLTHLMVERNAYKEQIRKGMSKKTCPILPEGSRSIRLSRTAPFGIDKKYSKVLENIQDRMGTLHCCKNTEPTCREITDKIISQPLESIIDERERGRERRRGAVNLTEDLLFGDSHRVRSVAPGSSTV